MTEDLLRLGNAVRGWIADGLDASDASQILAELLALDSRAWSTLAEGFPDLLSINTARAFINRGRSLVPVEPQKAISVTLIATKIAEHVSASDEKDGDGLIEIQGDAWKEYAQALLEVDRFPEAMEAAESASMYYIVPGHEHKSAILGLVSGEILHGLGHTADGLLTIEQNTNLLLSLFEDKKRYVQGRLIYAKLLINDQRIKEALEVFVSTADVAEELQDKELKAHILNNAGICYKHLRKLDKAKACVQTALEIFEELGQKSDVIRSRFELINILTAESRYKEAINQLFMNQNAFVAIGLPVDAALVGLAIVEILPLDGRGSDVPPLCTWMIDTFTRAGLHRRAMEALGHLNHVAQERGRLSPDDVECARVVLNSIRSAGSEEALDI